MSVVVGPTPSKRISATSSSGTVGAAPGVIQQPDPTSRSSLSVEMFTNPLTDVNDATWPCESVGRGPLPDQRKPAGYRREGPLSSSARIGDGLNPLTMR
jgi:hypothetical protein